MNAKPTLPLVLLAHIVGAMMLLWPAWINGYPLLFSDTNAFMAQSLKGHFVWDKPYFYGPTLIALHFKASLWPPLIAQALLVVNALWLLSLSLGRQTVSYLLLSCIVLSIVTALPWFTAFLMPDVFSGITVVALYVLAFGDRLKVWVRVWAGLIAVLSIGVHLTHLPIALACLVGVALFSLKRALAVLAAIACAFGIWITANGLAFNQYALSPHGSVFMLARLSADGHIEPVLQSQCDRQDWKLCSWRGKLPEDSDDFLWKPDGPVWTYPGGPIALSPEAKLIIRDAVVNNPVGVAISAAQNALTQMTKIRLGDTLTSIWLDETVGKYLREYFPQEEYLRFKASLQAQDKLISYATPLNTAHLIAVMAGFVLTIYLTISAFRRGHKPLCALGLMVMLGLIANGVATGALSKPHDRYQTRMAWLLVACPFWMVTSTRRTDQT